MKFIPFLPTLLLAGTIATVAPAKTYTCEITPAGSGAWIPEVVVVNHDESTGKVVVLDPIIKFYKDAPIEGRVGTDNARRTTFNWVLEDITVVAGAQRVFVNGFSFSLTVRKASHRASMSSTPLGYANRDRGDGRCTVE
ncbi:hypothetical protein [Aliiroseovarius sp.]|uniref:hypothetical protein n=1 Tax=Aliiroseovarius sp. TaxID=1872442 RepID=UPI0026089427|nr:hypothetical protein [Aliiroseovarius sp.]